MGRSAFERRNYEIPIEICFVWDGEVSKAQSSNHCKRSMLESIPAKIAPLPSYPTEMSRTKWSLNLSCPYLNSRSGGKKQVKIARPDEVLTWTGYPAGGVPPFGHPRPLPTWIDPGVLEQAMIYGGGGRADVLLSMQAAELQSLVGAEVVSVCR